jgi:two-component system, NtrC family, nitrogen regulation sensor histidine kinase NtrY
MSTDKSQNSKSLLSREERSRRKRESILIVVIIVVVALLTIAEERIIHFGVDIPVSNTILMFIVININLLLLILLIFLVLRNLVKLLYDRKRKVMGAKLRTRLVLAFVALTLLPTTVLFFFSINFIATSIEFWFNVPVEQALENSLHVGGSLYRQAEENNTFFLERVSYQIEKKKHLESKKKNALANYVQIAQRAFNLHAVEVYALNTERLAVSANQEDGGVSLQDVSTDNLQKEIPPDGVRTIAETVSAGELIRTIGTIPFGVERSKAEGLAVITILIPPDLSEKMASISRGFEEYQQIKLLKEPIQATYFIALSIVSLLVVFCAVWFGFYLAKTITIPIMELAEGTRKVAEGDLSFSINMVADDEIGSLVDSFNKMTHDLRISRDQLELSARLLRNQNVEIEERRQYMEIVLENVSAGVVSVDSGGVVSTVNKSAEKMLNIRAADILGKNFKDFLKGQYLDLASETIEGLLESQKGTVIRPLSVTIDRRPRSFITHISALKDDIGQNMGVLVVFDDITALERAQRMAAWREVARRIAHEVKNPLTPITLSAQRLKRRYSKRLMEPVFDECTKMIIDHVDLIRNLVNEFSAFARFPSANPEPCALPPIIEETVALYREGHRNIEFIIDLPKEEQPIKVDRRQIKQALINLVDNAVSSIKGHGCITASLTYDHATRRARIEVSDDGLGIPDGDKNRLFEPNFSTKKSGMGLGLTIVNTIISDHKGTIRVEDNRPRGARFIIELPV